MRFTLTRLRLAGLSVLLLILLALLLGFFFPPSDGAAGATDVVRPVLRLLASEYHAETSTLWLVEPTDPRSRESLARIAHAPGWDVVGRVGPTGDSAALLVLPPGGRDPETESALLLLEGEGAERHLTRLAAGLDLGGGLAWAADGRSIFVRRTTVAADGRRTYAVVEVDARGRASTRLQRNDVHGLYPIGRAAGGRLYVAAIDREGSALLAVDETGSVRSLRIASAVTRDWALSPDARQLAFTEQRGTRLRVRVVDVEPGRGASGLVAAAGSLSAQYSEGTAAPAWHPDGSLSVGAYGEDAALLRVAAAQGVQVDVEPAEGFVLPLWWAPTGEYVAVRAFSGQGPGAVGREWAAIVDAAGVTRSLPGNYVRVLGWWNGAG